VALAEAQDGSLDTIPTTRRLLHHRTQKHHNIQPGRAGDLDFGLAPLWEAWPITYGTASAMSPLELQVTTGKGTVNPNLNPVCRSLEAVVLGQRQTKTEVKEARIWVR
jgi:hypothetical protein